MELPAPAYIGSMAGEDSGGARSPKYPSTVTKVCNTHIVLSVAWIYYHCPTCMHVQVFVSAGQEVTKGTILMTVEGMKMEVSSHS